MRCDYPQRPYIVDGRDAFGYQSQYPTCQIQQILDFRCFLFVEYNVYSYIRSIRKFSIHQTENNEVRARVVYGFVEGNKKWNVLTSSSST